MPNFLRDAVVGNLVVTDEALQQLNAVLAERVNAHNTEGTDADRRLSLIYTVRFDGRGYRSFSAEEAWGYYVHASKVERVVVQAESLVGIQSNRVVGAHIEIRLDQDRTGTSHISVGGDSKDWVEATFGALEAWIARQRNLPTVLLRTQWTALAIQLLGILVGIVLCLWLATISGTYLRGVEYPRAIAFAFWFLVYGNLWGYLQQRALIGIGVLFPNVRFSRKGDHWSQALLRKGAEAAGIAVALWALSWLTKWATSVLAPVLGV